MYMGLLITVSINVIVVCHFIYVSFRGHLTEVGKALSMIYSCIGSLCRHNIFRRHSRAGLRNMLLD